jgi:membrane dipeptidase
VVLGTLFAPSARGWPDPEVAPENVYGTAEEAEAIALRQMDVYRQVSEEGEGFRLVGDAAELDRVLAGWEDGATGDVGIVPLMEGADPVVRPEDAPLWHERGVRAVGLAWRGTRYSGGTGEPGPLTAAGRRLVAAMGEAGLALDLSHAADESAREALDLFDGVVIASHSNPRALCAGDRQLPDDVIRAIGRRGGVVGAVPFNRLLVAGWTRADGGAVAIERVAECVHHVAQVTGTHHAAAIGSDFDGGFGAECAPRGLDTVADLPRLGDALSAMEFGDDEIEDVLGRNWIRLLRRALPAGVRAS